MQNKTFLKPDKWLCHSPTRSSLPSPSSKMQTHALPFPHTQNAAQWLHLQSKTQAPSILLSPNSTTPPSLASPFSSSTFVGTTHLSLTAVSLALSPSVLLSHNLVDTWVSTAGFDVGFYPYRIFIFIFGS